MSRSARHMTRGATAAAAVLATLLLLVDARVGRDLRFLGR